MILPFYFLLNSCNEGVDASDDCSSPQAPNEELVAENDVVNGLYSDFCPMLRQPPYTMMVKISVQQKMAETMYQSLGTTPSEMSNDALLMLSLVHDIVTDAVSLAECPDSES